MTKPILHFAHANSYPAGTYRVFFKHLAKNYDVQALDMHAHNPAYPVRDGWTALARELTDELAARYTQPVILAGHSMGGMLSLMAAKARPELVRCVVMLDSPVVAGWRALLLGVAKRIGVDKKFSPAQFSENRRHLWPDADAAYRHYASKAMFAAWPPQVLRDYIEHGLKPHPQGVTLRFTRETETAVYRSLPHHVGAQVRRGFPVPVGFVGGTESVECRQAGLAATRRLVGRHFAQVPGGHLFPMESPAIAAHAVHAMIQSLLQS
ncbi:alpha/beta fold hydrolase [Noviherbaspirillum autotrophicum]|uniref:Alpha/beta hydrolase n=1 Tax=Noviherbaspirillum autotrophicum TaxID=709839 RepID=A0A0C2BI17_9BURK|nr:alpha/beta hydrolase [Noviherbaspirillum autotrophicum]KIF80860.1 alpha/beta hydrolase [Noviherbaspirillum autotrophicum]